MNQNSKLTFTEVLKRRSFAYIIFSMTKWLPECPVLLK